MTICPSGFTKKTGIRPKLMINSVSACMGVCAFRAPRTAGHEIRVTRRWVARSTQPPHEPDLVGAPPMRVDALQRGGHGRAARGAEYYWQDCCRHWRQH